MKNWNYIEGAKVGNYTPNYRYKGFLITNPEGYEFVVFLQDGLHVGYRGTTSKAQAEDWCDWHDPKTGKPVAKFRNSKIGNDTPIEYAHRKPKVINEDKTGAEEFFKKLSDDVKEREKKDDADIEKVGNFKTGTSQLKPGDKVMSFGKKGTVKEVIGENTDNIYGEPLIKVEFEDGTTKTIGEHYMRKVGNAKYVIQYERNLRAPMAWGDYNIVDEANPKKIIRTTSDREEAKRICEELNRNQSSKWTDVYKHFTKASTSELDKIKTKKDALDFLMAKGEHPNEPAVQEAARRFFGNKRTGNSTVSEYNSEIQRLTKKAEQLRRMGQGRQAMEVEKQIEKLGKELSEIGNKVGNARYTTREDVISHLDTDLYDICKKVPAGSPSFAYVSELQKKGWDISTISKYTKEIGKIIDQYKVGNSKTGNATYTEADRKRLYELAKKRNKTAQEWAEFDELNRREEQASRELIKKIGKPKTGNSAQDDKFAYVMREFDAGKLKTPDGKVVTDPAQAKAIAYSESKKTENGLARARKAMNKKVGNHDFEEGDYVLYNGQKAVVRGFNGQEVIIEQNGRRITTHWSNLEEYE